MTQKKEILQQYPDAICEPYTHFGLVGKHECYRVNIGPPQLMQWFFGNTETDAWLSAYNWFSSKPEPGVILLDETNCRFTEMPNVDMWQERNKDLIILPTDTVKLNLFDKFGSESIWIKITQVQPDFILGTLSNDPVSMRFVQFGTPVKFKREYIQDYHKYS